MDNTTKEAYDRMQEAIDRWEGRLKATGGALRPDTSFVYPIILTWDAKDNNKLAASSSNVLLLRLSRLTSGN